MFDFSGVDITKIAIHRVGNRFKNEGIITSSKPIDLNDSTMKNLLLKYFLSSFKDDIIYNFNHEVDLNLNEVYVYLKNIFDCNTDFFEQSVNILKHLYEASIHPNIKSGELYITYISNCIIDKKTVDAIGIFKSENKDTYLRVLNRNTEFDVEYQKGININKLDKGCLIFNTEADKGYKVAIVDTSRSSEAVYWKDNFLNVKIKNNQYSNTKSFLNLCKDFTNNIYEKDKKEKVVLLNNSIDYFNQHDEFNIEKFTKDVINEPLYVEKFKNYVSNYEKEFAEVDFKHFEISPKAVKTVKRNIKNFIKLDKDIEIRFKTQKESYNQIIEKGYDEGKNMHFYKIYFNSEE